MFFYAKFSLDDSDFSSDFYALDFLSITIQAAELNWRQFNTKSQMKSVPKLVSFFDKT